MKIAVCQQATETERASLFDRLTKYDQLILAGAVVMCAGVFMPIVRLPIVGSISYFVRGSGDGVIVLLAGFVIVGLTLGGWRRTAALVGLGCCAWMAIALSKILIVITQVHSEADILAKNNPFGGLAKLVAQSIGLEWGWVPLIGGALMVLAGGLIQPSRDLIAAPETPQDAFDADQAIARYMKEAARVPDSRIAESARSGPHATVFGRRNRRSAL